MKRWFLLTNRSFFVRHPHADVWASVWKGTKIHNEQRSMHAACVHLMENCIYFCGGHNFQEGSNSCSFGAPARGGAAQTKHLCPPKYASTFQNFLSWSEGFWTKDKQIKVNSLCFSAFAKYSSSWRPFVVRITLKRTMWLSRQLRDQVLPLCVSSGIFYVYFFV